MNSLRNSTCLSGKVRTELSRQIAKTTGPGLLETTFLVHYFTCFSFSKDNLAIYINNQLQTVVGLKAFEELRSRVMGLKVFNNLIYMCC